MTVTMAARNCPLALRHAPRRHGPEIWLRERDRRRAFHEYFVTHLPSSSLHPEPRSSGRPHHNLPRSASSPHTPGSGALPAAAPPMAGTSRELTVLRIPLKGAKHHFGVSVSRGTRPYNEDTYQAGVIEIPAFAQRAPMSLTRSQRSTNNGEPTSAENVSGDPQVFYFGVFDGHGGAECSTYLKGKLHTYIEESAKQFELGSSLREVGRSGPSSGSSSSRQVQPGDTGEKSKQEDSQSDVVEQDADRIPAMQKINEPKAVDLEASLVHQWKELVGGYFRRFRPEYFFLSSRDGTARDPQLAKEEADRAQREGAEPTVTEVGIETVLTYAFLKADLDFITAQVARSEDDPVLSDKALNDGDILGQASTLRKPSQSQKTFTGGSTCSVAMISTPTPTPFWNPASPSSLVTSHVGDSRIILCTTANGQAKPLTTDHHPSSPGEGNRLRRYAATFVTDSFGEERMTGLANTRAFGDMQSKRIGVSAEPEIQRLEMKPAEYSFLVLVSDGISGTLSDQEIVDIVKEAKTPDQGAKDVVGFATEVSKEGDNATCLVIRLGGWERRSEGGLGSMGTKEGRDWRSQEASEPRSRRQ